MSTNTQRFDKRSLTLKDCFQDKAMCDAWQKFIKDGMRKQPILDLHDYYDFHKNRNAIISVICEQIISGCYRAKPLQVVRSEKKYGICRHLQIPSPDDAVILQTLVEKFHPIIKASQPSDRAYYSRSHSQIKSEADVDDSFPYEWWELWPKFQEKIYQFSDTYKYVVVTDIANYYDNISFDRLRNVISSYGKFDEELLDFLFYMLEAFVWRPDYLPLSGFGLPQVNFDAPRLFGHAFLFEIDQYLNQATNGNFVRWMDDIDFAVNELTEAKKILKNLDELLLTRGLRLNMAKTKVLSSSDAKKHFYLNENRFLTIISNIIDRRIETNRSLDDIKKKIKYRFKKFLKHSDGIRWSKVYKRYFTIARKTNDRFLEKNTKKILQTQPELRDSVLLYYRELGYNKKRFNDLKGFFLSEHCMCDVTVFSVSNVLVSWEIPAQSLNVKDLVIVSNQRMKNISSPASFISSLWLIGKYGSKDELFSLVWSNISIWKNSSFLARQVAALMPIFRQKDDYANKIEKTLVETGHIDAVRVLKSFESMRFVKHITKDMIMYLSQKNRGIYPLSKFLILMDVLSSQHIDIKERENLQNDILNRVITDSVYIRSIQKLNISYS